MCVPQRYLNAFMNEPVRNRHRRKAHVDQQGKLYCSVQWTEGASNEDYKEKAKNIFGYTLKEIDAEFLEWSDESDKGENNS